MDASTKRKLVVAGVAGGLGTIAMAVGVAQTFGAKTGAGAIGGTAIALFLSVLVTEYLTDVLLK